MSRKVAIAAALAAALVAAAPAAADTIRVQSTTDTVDAGLVNGIGSLPGLIALYGIAHPEDTVQYTPVGTGAALQNARNGQGDVVITHAPSLEQQFVNDGYSLGLGRQIFYSDYVIVGPTNDPAGVATKDPHNAVGAFQDIATTGAGPAPSATFVSRGDNSGTNVQEQIIWGLTDASVPKALAANGGGDPTRFTPTDTSWYKASTVPIGQAANVQATSACTASTYPKGGCYTMTDRGTFNKLVNAGTVTNLKIVSQQNDASAPGGANLLINPFSAYVVNPAKVAGVNATAAQRFVDFLVSANFQAYLPTFPTAVDPAFRPDAFPALSLDGPLPATAANGATLTLTGGVRNQLPGSGPITGMPLVLQRSTDGGSTWSNAGTSTPTDGTGRFSVSAVATQTAAYRLFLPYFPASSRNAFSPSTQTLGTVTVPVNPPPKPPDKTKPRVKKLKITARRISFTASEAATVRFTIQARKVVTVRRNGKRVKVVRYGKARHVTIRAKKAGKVSKRLKTALKPQRYRTKIRATDRAGNVKRYTVTFTIKKAKAKSRT